MNEVKVYDRFGNLKQVISVKMLNERAEEQSKFPSLFRRNKKPAKPVAKAPATRTKA
ncbi:MAG: hypothetical protein HY579_03205 [Nitrospinae bacterium]|nr:hypothetical protein [Nitrospinota bacterium]MBI5428405.1 hypothetical protein [Nitrospinota bacterium]